MSVGTHTTAASAENAPRVAEEDVSPLEKMAADARALLCALPPPRPAREFVDDPFVDLSGRAAAMNARIIAPYMLLADEVALSFSRAIDNLLTTPPQKYGIGEWRASVLISSRILAGGNDAYDAFRNAIRKEVTKRLCERYVPAGYTVRMLWTSETLHAIVKIDVDALRTL